MKRAPNRMEFLINVYYPIESTFINRNGKKGAIFDVINEEIVEYLTKYTSTEGAKNAT